jgi:hypothetical protein
MTGEKDLVPFSQDVHLEHQSLMSNRPILYRSLAVIAIVAFCAMPASASDPSIDLDLYAKLLESHTRPVDKLVQVEVDYQAFGRSAEFKRLAGQVRTAKPSQLTRDAKLAFWINAYNILTIELITKHYPLDGIKEIGSFFSPVWDLEVATIEGRSISLGEIEHEILRKMGEPRIHAAIVCASLSCPPLARTPFRPATLDQDLSTAMRTWLSNPEKGIAIDQEKRTIALSKIFDWFEEDFESRGGVLVAIEPYLPADAASWLRENGRNARIRYFQYDWSLNGID